MPKNAWRKNHNLRNIAIIPARGQSKRLVDKNISPLGDLPLLVHSIQYAKANSTIIDDVYVTTDCVKIKQVALQFGAKVIDRPSELSGDYNTTVSALKHAMQFLERVDTIILLQPTNPLRPANLLLEAYSQFQETNADSLFTVTENKHKFGKIVDGKLLPYNYKYGQRSQDLETLYYENGLLYITKPELIHRDIIISESAIPFIVNHIFATVDIDVQEDLEYAEYLYNKTRNNSSNK